MPIVRGVMFICSCLLCGESVFVPDDPESSTNIPANWIRDGGGFCPLHAKEYLAIRDRQIEEIKSFKRASTNFTTSHQYRGGL